MAYATAFSPTHTNMIYSAISSLANRTNKYFMPSPVPYHDLLQMLLPPDEHEEALMLPRTHARYLANDVFIPMVSMQSMGGRLGITFIMDKGEPGAFAILPDERTLQPVPEAETFKGKTNSWLDNAARWGFVRHMFDTANSAAYPGDKRYVRHLLPGILPLLKIAGLPDVAAKLAPPVRDLKGRMPDAHTRTALVMANQIIAEGLLYEQLPHTTRPAGHAGISINTHGRVSVEVPANEALEHDAKTYTVYPLM